MCPDNHPRPLQREPKVSCFLRADLFSSYLDRTGEWRKRDRESECIRVAFNKRRGGTRIRVLSHEISIQNALRALVPQDYTPGAMNLPLRGRPEIATFLALFPPAPFSRTSHSPALRRKKGKRGWRLTFRRLPESTITFRPRMARAANFWRSFSRSPASVCRRVGSAGRKRDDRYRGKGR